MHRAYRPQLVFWVPFGLLFAVVKSIGAIDWASSTKHMTAAVTQTVRMAVVTSVFSLPIGNRRLPPIFTDTATRRQPIPAVNFEKFRPNLKFSKIFEIKKEKIW